MRQSMRQCLTGLILLAAAAGPAAAQTTPPAAAPGSGAHPFQRLYEVMSHPRCLNCHTNVDHPKQGDARRRHTMMVVRGADDAGGAVRCASCHQAANNASSVVPGAPHWQLAPLSMGWEGKSAGDLCRVLLDKALNGGRDAGQIVEHLVGDPLVQWAFAPGAARTLPPLTREAFHAEARAWLAAGAPCPR
jgi:hypothetical protein